MRKVYIRLVISVQATLDEGVQVSELLDEMDYSFKSNTPGATIEDEEILDYEITYSK